jgi:peptidoglycan/LPS O-acetylase OafA/YrhL
MTSISNWIHDTFEISHAGHNAIRSMEGIRGFAVFLVFLVHYVTLIEPWLSRASLTHEIAKNIHSIGNIGVDLFFVLSGYLIYGMLIKKPTEFRKYLYRRIQRIYPTFTVVFAVYLILSLVFTAESKIPGDWKSGLIFVIQNYLLLPGLFDIQPIITVAWSLSYEFFYYLLIPLLISTLKLRNWPRRYRTLLFFSASLLLFYYFYYQSGPIRLLMFISGIVLYEVVTGGFLKNIPPLGLLALILAIISIPVSNYYTVNIAIKYLLLYSLFFIFCLECFSTAGFTNRLFSLAYLRWLGNMSYSYYLIHGLCLKALFMALPKILPASHGGELIFWILIIPSFVLTLLPATALFYWVEKPFSLQRK